MKSQLQQLLDASSPKPRVVQGNIEVKAADFEEARRIFNERYAEQGWKINNVLQGREFPLGTFLFRFFVERTIQPGTGEKPPRAKRNSSIKQVVRAAFGDNRTFPEVEEKSVGFVGHNLLDLTKKLLPYTEDGWEILWKSKTANGYDVRLKKTTHPPKCMCGECDVPKGKKLTAQEIDKDAEVVNGILGKYGHTISDGSS